MLKERPTRLKSVQPSEHILVTQTTVIARRDTKTGLCIESHLGYTLSAASNN